MGAHLNIRESHIIALPQKNLPEKKIAREDFSVQTQKKTVRQTQNHL
jgi:hypothetical protein